MKDRIIEFLKYGFFGCVTTGINLLLFFLLSKAGMYYVLANGVSYVIAVVISYYFNNRLVFNKNKSKEKVKWAKYILMRGLSILVDSGVLMFCREIVGLDLMLSKILTSAIIILLTYIVSKLWVFAGN